MTQAERHQQYLTVAEDVIANYAIQGAAPIACRHDYAESAVRSIAAKLGIRRNPELLLKEKQESIRFAKGCQTEATHRKIGTAMRCCRLKDILRVKAGLPQQTKFLLSTYSKEEIHQQALARRRLKKHSYIVPKGSFTIYYDDTTDRRPLLEQRYSQNWRFTFTEKTQEQ